MREVAFNEITLLQVLTAGCWSRAAWYSMT